MMVLVLCSKFFSFWLVDNALEGYKPWFNEGDFYLLFHTESHDTHIDFLWVFFSGRQDYPDDRGGSNSIPWCIFLEASHNIVVIADSFLK